VRRVHVEGASSLGREQGSSVAHDGILLKSVERAVERTAVGPGDLAVRRSEACDNAQSREGGAVVTAGVTGHAGRGDEKPCSVNGGDRLCAGGKGSLEVQEVPGASISRQGGRGRHSSGLLAGWEGLGQPVSDDSMPEIDSGTDDN
jgi:hypothetical protein